MKKALSGEDWTTCSGRIHTLTMKHAPNEFLSLYDLTLHSDRSTRIGPK